ncbi:MAG: diacylglycerol kinase [Saprospiraceae bacterium]
MSKFSLKSRASSFKHAFNGLIYLIKNEPNFRIHLAAAILSVCLGFYLKISALEWIALTICIGLVMATETLNTALEELCDLIHPEQHPKIKNTKDLGAAAALVTAVTALLIGLIIFIPKLFYSC